MSGGMVSIPAIGLERMQRELADARARAAELEAAAGIRDAGQDAAAARLMLSRREVDILEGLAAGETRAETAARLFIAENTVRKHCQRIFPRLGVHTAAGAVALCFRRGVLR